MSSIMARPRSNTLRLRLCWDSALEFTQLVEVILCLVIVAATVNGGKKATRTTGAC